MKAVAMKIKTSPRDRLFQVINYLVFAVFTFLCVYPFYYLIINSISANDLSANGMINWIPMFMTMKTLHLTNNFLVYIIPAIVQPFNIIMVKTYIESIPASLQEAAEMDGAGILTRFFRIVLPISKPILFIYPMFQKHFAKGIMIGSVKG